MRIAPEYLLTPEFDPVLESSAALSSITICLPNFNGMRHLAESLGAVYPLRHELAEILLVDNASTDGSVDFVRREFPDVRIIALPTNQGPGAARNTGYRLARTDRILFVDNDVALTADCLRGLTAALDVDDRAAIAVPRVFFRHDPDTIQYDGAGCHYLGLMTLENANARLNGAGATIRELDSFVSAAFLIDRRRWGPGELFDERFFIYLEDHDLGLRTRLRGWKILAVPEAHCYHGEGTTGLSLRSTGAYQPVRVTATIRNRWCVLLKNYHRRTLLLLTPALLVFEVFQLAGVLKKGWHREWAGALAGVARQLPALAVERRRIQRTRVTPDRDLLRGGPLPFTPQLTQGRVEQLAHRALQRFNLGYWTMVRRWL